MGSSLVVVGADDDEGAVDVSSAGAVCSPDVPRKASRTTDTTNATVATDTATTTTAVGPVRYHGVGAALKFQVLESKASNVCSSASVGGGGSTHSTWGCGSST